MSEMAKKIGYVDDSRAIAGETEKRFVGPKDRPGVLLVIEELPE